MFVCILVGDSSCVISYIILSFFIINNNNKKRAFKTISLLLCVRFIIHALLYIDPVNWSFMQKQEKTASA